MVEQRSSKPYAWVRFLLSLIIISPRKENIKFRLTRTKALQNVYVKNTSTSIYMSSLRKRLTHAVSKSFKIRLFLSLQSGKNLKYLRNSQKLIMTKVFKNLIPQVSFNKHKTQLRDYTRSQK